MSEKLDKAIAFAIKAHSGQTRKMDKSPYILHPLEDAAIVNGITHDEDVIVAAVLHDTVEDTDTTIEEIKEMFGERVAYYVADETEDKRADRPPEETWKIRKEETLKILKEADDINVKILWLGDKVSNMRSLYRKYLEIGDKAFDFFNQKDKTQQAWYYEKIAEYTSELKDTPAHMEYVDLINKIFN